MKIGIDCSLVPEVRSGVGQYTLELVRALARLDEVNEYTLYPFFYNIFNPRYKDAVLPKAANFKTAFRDIPAPGLFRYLWYGAMPGFIKERMLGDVEVVHSTTFSAPRFKDKKKRLVVTIYDLTVLTHPECHKWMNRKIVERGLRATVKNADAVIAISQNTKADIMNILRIPEERITVTYLAAGTEFKENVDVERRNAVKDKYGLPEKYMFFLGSLEPRKNIKTLIKAYSILPESLKKEFSLVVAGGVEWLSSDIPAFVKSLNIEDKVVFAGYIESADKGALYSMASVFVYPSLYEGFGLPILEAMASGTPVVTSNTSSMPEVAGNAAILVSPLDSQEMSAAMARILDDKDHFKDLRAKGLVRAAAFSWDRCAAETLEVYKKVHLHGKL